MDAFPNTRAARKIIWRPCSETMNKITAMSNIGEILERWPHLATIFLNHHMSCPGCHLASFEDLADALEIYRLPVDPFVDRLNHIVENSD